MRPIGFSTGALARGDFRRGLALLRSYQIQVVGLSALRMEELEPLIDALPDEYQHTAYNILHALKSIIPVATPTPPVEEDGPGSTPPTQGPGGGN